MFESKMVGSRMRNVLDYFECVLFHASNILVPLPFVDHYIRVLSVEEQLYYGSSAQVQSDSFEKPAANISRIFTESFDPRTERIITQRLPSKNCSCSESLLRVRKKNGLKSICNMRPVKMYQLIS